LRGVGSLLRDTLGRLLDLLGRLLCRPLRRVRSTFSYLTGCVRRLSYRVGSPLCDLAYLLGGLSCGVAYALDGLSRAFA
jgi:hypothetical protein